MNFLGCDPLALGRLLWPHVVFYKEQRDIVYSVWENDETCVPAANMMGKDYVGGFIALVAFLTRHPCRIVTTSAKDDHLRVLWGEIGNFINTSVYPLTEDKGGPLIWNHQELRKIMHGKECELSYVKGMVAAADRIAAMQGHHIANTGDGVWRTLFLSDESSSVPHDYHKMASTWANRMYYFGNTWPCNNFFYHAVKGKPGTQDKGGDIARPSGNGFFRKVIHIRATDSPNVKLGLAQRAAGIEPSYEMLIPGVKSYAEYEKNLIMWDPHQQCVSLNAEFYEGAELKLFPPEWLNLARELARKLRGNRLRKARAVGIDPAEGGDKTAMAAVDEYGLIELVSKKTPNTAVITGEAIAFMKKHGVEPYNVVFDRGGGGKEHADRLRAQGYKVRTVSFGEPLTVDPKRGLRPVEQKMERKEDKYAYKNRRAELYGELSMLLDPSLGTGFGMPEEYAELFHQLSKFPKQYDEEGRMMLPAKNRKPGEEISEEKPTLVELIGHSPDEADAVALAVHGMLHKAFKGIAGAAI